MILELKLSWSWVDDTEIYKMSVKEEKVTMRCFKRGLVIIYDPHALLQFINFYCMHEYDIKWDALCLPKENTKDDIHLHCEQTGIFENVYCGNVEYKCLGLFKKGVAFLNMLCLFLIHKQSLYCKKELSKYIGDIEQYDVFAAQTETGFLSGMLALLAKEKTVVYFEDGAGDYIHNRYRWRSVYDIWSPMNLQCVIMARMGYFGKGYTYLNSTCNTLKYASRPEELLYKNYRAIHQMDSGDTITEAMKEILERTYPELSNLKSRISDKTAIVFSDPIKDECSDCDEYIEDFYKYITERHEDILLKAHPREKAGDYTIPEGVYRIDSDIPAEVILQYLRGNTCYFMMPNSIMIAMRGYDVNIIVLYSQSILDQINRTEEYMRDYESMDNYCSRFLKDNYDIISLN